MWAGWQVQIENKHGPKQINWFNDFNSDTFPLDFDSLFPTVDLKSFSHFVIETINW